jgi:EAL domain-containing protein (putative c-di-GMP-specific phosphodiesterase class I)
MSSILEEIAEEGVQLALDDFGTGYSSLSLLQHLPVHTLKIDRSFIRSVEFGPERRAFVRAIVELAHALGLPVVAEGIEMPGQAEELLRLGCGLGQGFFFAKPLEAGEFEELVSTELRASEGAGVLRLVRRRREAA